MRCGVGFRWLCPSISIVSSPISPRPTPPYEQKLANNPNCAMCGRYSMGMRLDRLRMHMREDGVQADEFIDEAESLTNYFPSNVINPVTNRPVIYRSAEGGALHGRLMRWAFVPHYEKEIPKNKPPVFNARSDNLSSPMWAAAFNSCGRCIVPADGYYEWMTPKSSAGNTSKPSKKVPYYVRPKNGGLMYFAGLYSTTYLKPARQAGEEHSSDGTAPEENTLSATKMKRILYSYAIITTEAVDSIKFLHSRMPLILYPGTPEFENWLNPAFKDLGKLPRVNKDEEVVQNLTWSVAEIHLSGKMVGKSLKDKGDIGKAFARVAAKQQSIKEEFEAIKEEPGAYESDQHRNDYAAEQDYKSILKEEKEDWTPEKQKTVLPASPRPSTVSKPSKRHAGSPPGFHSTPTKKSRAKSASSSLDKTPKITSFFTKKA
ncbi:hypothetical protein BZA70DRAFT_270969 [Myxozyma melibiosi]|uniref:DUF159-domain-containing protein n=1 Tax=Myxozyma melibiosi TaxID=54550 RepID=A0ABR1FDR9_9ASCO